MDSDGARAETREDAELLTRLMSRVRRLDGNFACDTSNSASQSDDHRRLVLLGRIADTLERHLGEVEQDLADATKTCGVLRDSRDDMYRRYRALSAAFSAQTDPLAKASADAGAGEQTSSPTTLRAYLVGDDMHTLTGEVVDGAIRVLPGEAGFGVYGPYADLRAALYEVTFLFDRNVDCRGRVWLDVCEKGTILSRQELQLEQLVDENGQFRFFVDLKHFTQACEFRLESSDAEFSFRGCLVRDLWPQDLPTLLIPVRRGERMS